MLVIGAVRRSRDYIFLTATSAAITVPRALVMTMGAKSLSLRWSEDFANIDKEKTERHIAVTRVPEQVQNKIEKEILSPRKLIEKYIRL